MANTKQTLSAARTWATAHVVAAAIIACAAGLIIGLVLG